MTPYEGWTHPKRRNSFARTVRTVLYVVMVMGGSLAMIAPPLPLTGAFGPTWTAVWGGYLIIGGLCCLATSLTDRWIGEYVGLNLLWSGVATYAVATLLDTETTPWRGVGGVLLSALALSLWDRWLDVRAIARVAQGPDDDDVE